jgi:hypothetical protein
MPPAIPTYLVLTLNDRVFVVNTFRGVLIREFAAPSRDIRVAFLGDRLLYVRTERADAGCHFHVEAFDIETGESRWAEPGFDLDTARGAGCEQRQDPLGAGARLVVNGSDAKPMLVEVDQAVRTWTGVPGERVLATDGLLAVILAADGTHVKVIDAATVDGRTLWTGAVGLDAQAAITRAFVIIRDADAERLLVLRKGSTSMSVKLELKSKATVVGAGADGILLSTARYVGYHQVAA